MKNLLLTLLILLSVFAIGTTGAQAHPYGGGGGYHGSYHGGYHNCYYGGYHGYHHCYYGGGWYAYPAYPVYPYPVYPAYGGVTIQVGL